MSTKKDLDKKRELARIYFLQGDAQNTIAEKVEVSKVTVNKWVKDGNWENLRAASNITRPELVNKILKAINDLLDKAITSNDPAAINGLSDKLAKFASVIEKLDKKANIVDIIEVFMAFGKWIQYRSSFDPELTPELIKAINRYQDLYISEQLSTK